MKIIKQQLALNFQWPTQDPFLFCVHHLDHYPPGNSTQGLDSKYLKGRNIGQDFEPKDGFRLYHGEEIPGFPVHPHRGFETITIVRNGFADHADSLGASGRYGEGDVQWMTAGSGVQHSEMFPLLHSDKENTLELFQIWLNLPKSHKMVPADFKMLWAENIPKIKKDPLVEISLIHGEIQGESFREAPSNSWAKNPANEVNILLVKIMKGGHFKFNKSQNPTHRSLYFFIGNEMRLNDELIKGKSGLFLDSSLDLDIFAEFHEVEFLILEARPINEPMAQHGPFVMNSKEEILQTIREYQVTQFGGWKWARPDMSHGPGTERFAKYPDGHMERP